MKPKIRILSEGNLPPELKAGLEKEFKKQNSEPDFSKHELNTMIGNALADAMKTDLFKGMPKDLQKALKESFSDSLPKQDRPDLSEVANKIHDLLVEYDLNCYEGAGVLEAVKAKIAFHVHCKRNEKC